MEQFFIHLANSFSGFYGYLMLGVCAFVENVVPPIPGDTVTVLGGYLAATGRLSFAGVVGATTLGSFAGFMLMFFLGKALGRKFFLERDRRLFSREKLVAVTGWFARFGYGVVLGNRFLSGARSVISLCAGISGLHTGGVALLCLASCLVWNVILISAGYTVGENWEAVLALLKKYNALVLCLLGAALCFWIFKKTVSRRSRHR